jgi:biopolymer transport protein ExbD
MLLIYFLLTTNFMVDEGIKVKLPQARSGAPQIKQEITIYVDKEGQPWLAQKKFTLIQLFTELKQLIGHDKDRLVIIKADRSVILNKAVKVMDMAKAAGATRLSLATEKDF